MSKFIVFEGIEGTGKTTQVLNTINYLRHYRHLFVTKEPTPTKLGHSIKKLLWQDNDPEANPEKYLKLYTKDRKQHVKEITKQLNLGNVVISDRYYYSTIAYQHIQGQDIKKLLKQSKQFIVPDLTIILDIPAKTALKRTRLSRKRPEKFDNLEFNEKLREIYLKMPYYAKYLDKNSSKKENIKIIDGSRTPEKVFEEIKEELKRF